MPSPSNLAPGDADRRTHTHRCHTPGCGHVGCSGDCGRAKVKDQVFCGGMIQSVRGALRNGAWKHDLVGACTDKSTGRVLTADEIFDELCNHLTQGHEYLPYADCDNWDYKNGRCLGHEKKEEG